MYRKKSDNPLFDYVFDGDGVVTVTVREQDMDDPIIMYFYGNTKNLAMIFKLTYG